MLKEFIKDDTVTFTNSAGRTITGTVTIVERTIGGGTWVTVFECPGSVYKLPVSAIKKAQIDAQIIYNLRIIRHLGVYSSDYAINCIRMQK